MAKSREKQEAKLRKKAQKKEDRAAKSLAKAAKLEAKGKTGKAAKVRARAAKRSEAATEYRKQADIVAEGAPVTAEDIQADVQEQVGPEVEAYQEYARAQLPEAEQIQGELQGYQNVYAGLGAEAQAIQEQYMAEAAGVDPRFAAYKEAQLAEVGRQSEAARGTMEQAGVTGTALMNEMAKFDTRSSDISAQVGMQEMGRQDAARQGAVGMLGQRAGITGAGAALTPQEMALLQQQIGVAGQPLQAAQVMPTLDIAALAAENAGKGPGGAGGNNWWDVGNWDWNVGNWGV